MNRRIFHRQFTLTLTTTVGSFGLLAGCPAALRSEAPPSPLHSNLGIVGAIASSTDLESANPEVVETTSLNRADQIAAGSKTDVSAVICAALPDWQRPSDTDHAKLLEEVERYGSAIYEEPLASWVKQWQSNDAFSFTTYGLSARVDPLYMSGVWTAVDSLWDCYATNQPELINTGQLAEVWLLGHSLLSLEWADDTYTMVVEPAATGLQVVQFRRMDGRDTLPLTITTPDGEPVNTMSGDW